MAEGGPFSFRSAHQYRAHVYRITEDWNETSITWWKRDAYNNWGNEGVSYDNSRDFPVDFTTSANWWWGEEPDFTGIQFIDFDLTTLVREWYQGDYPNYGFILVPETLWIDVENGGSTNNNYGGFALSDYPDAIYHPKLTININRSPICSAATASVATMWPPNHQWANTMILNTTDPDGDAVNVNITRITSDEPTASDKGSGGSQHTPDAQGINTDTAQLRVERSGQGNGRVYGINFVVSDPYGATCQGYVTVCVPQDQGKNKNCIDSGQKYDATLFN
jgi:hypothetical protein